MNTMNPVIHFEMPAEDMGRMRKFYEDIFGWGTKQLGKDMGEYVLVTTSETDENQMAKKPGTINGGFYQKMKDPISQCPAVVVAVENIDRAMKKVKESGGKVIGGEKKDGTPDDIPGVGLYASIIDTEGNRVGVLQPKDIFFSFL